MRLNFSVLFLILFILLILFSTLRSSAQSAQTTTDSIKKNEIEILKEKVDKHLIEFSKLKKLKISGYIQAQFEVGQEFAVTKAGSLTTYNKERDGKAGDFFRFGIRRGYLKIAWQESFGSAVFQIDVTEKGIGIKDAYIKVSEPWLKVASLTAGIFDRPFGDEIGYSSALMETAERTVLFQKLFPDERDLGGMVTLAAPEKSKLYGLKLDAGAFCGNGIAMPDNGKMDFIGHLKYEKIYSKIAFGVGVSMYYGTVRNTDSILYNVQKVDDKHQWVGSEVSPFQKNIRQYYGLDAQFLARTSWGFSNLRGEILFGTQPSTKSDISSPKTGLMQYSKDANGNYNSFNRIRKFWGAHLYFIQDIYKTPLSVVFRYSFLNPNRELKGHEIMSKTDLPYHYFGAGVLVKCTSYLRFMCYYELPFNSTKNDIPVPAKPADGKIDIADFQKHVKEGIFTCRLQFKF